MWQANENPSSPYSAKATGRHLSAVIRRSNACEYRPLLIASHKRGPEHFVAIYIDDHTFGTYSELNCYIDITFPCDTDVTFIRRDELGLPRPRNVSNGGQLVTIEQTGCTVIPSIPSQFISKSIERVDSTFLTKFVEKWTSNK